MRKGYLQVYTGDGKGKTTAALGLALRAAGAGLKVFIAQFIKKKSCSEHRILSERFRDLITVRQYGTGLILKRAPAEADVEAARNGIEEVQGAMESKEYDMIILDEANVAVHLHLIGIGDLLDLVEKKPARMELVITGRYAPAELLEKADLVTEMKEIRHYHHEGVKARRGIEW